MVNQRRAMIAVGFLTVGCLAGCAEVKDGLDRQSIAGTVTLDGSPLAKASLLFEPVGSGVTAVTAVGAEVIKGRFRIGRQQGPVPGEYLARLYASSGEIVTGPPGGSGRAPRPMVELIPPRYNRDSTLQVSVTSGGPNEFHFAMVSDPVTSTR